MTHPLDGALMRPLTEDGHYGTDLHNFDEETCLPGGCVPFADLTKRAHISEHDRQHVFRVIRDQSATNWGAHLLRLIHLSDLPNRQTLAVVYPDYVAAYERAMMAEGSLDEWFNVDPTAPAGHIVRGHERS